MRKLNSRIRVISICTRCLFSCDQAVFETGVSLFEALRPISSRSAVEVTELNTNEDRPRFIFVILIMNVIVLE